MTLETITRDIAIAQVDFARLNAGHWLTRNAIGHYCRRRYVALDAETEAKIGALAERLCRLHKLHSILAAKEFVARDKVMCNGSVSKQFGC